MILLIVLMVLFPSIAIVVYSVVWDVGSYKTTSAGITLTVPGSTVYQSPAFSSGPSDFDLSGITLYYMKNDHGEACTDPDTPAVLPAGLVIDDVTKCYPEEVAAKLEERGYSLLIINSVYKIPGYTAKSLWKVNRKRGIPIVEVSHDSDVKDWAQAELQIDVSPSDNPINEFKNEAVVSVMAALNGCLAIFEICLAGHRLYHLQYSESAKHVSKSSLLITICSVFLCSSLFKIVLQIADPFGTRHIFPFPAQITSYIIGSIFSFITAVLLGVMIHTRLLFIDGKSARRNPLIIAVILLTLILIIISCSAVYMLWTLTPGSGYFLVVAAVDALLFHLIASSYFVYCKYSLIETYLRLRESVKGQAQERQAEVMRRMSGYLFLTVFPMILLACSLGLYLVFFTYEMYPILPLCLAMLSVTLIELMQVSSIPT